MDDAYDPLRPIIISAIEETFGSVENFAAAAEKSLRGLSETCNQMAEAVSRMQVGPDVD